MKRLLAIALLVPLLGCSVARAQFVVDSVDARRVDQVINVDAYLDLSLTDAAEDALSHGVPLIVIHEIALSRQVWFWHRIERQVSIRHRLRYHALSGRYVVDRGEVVLDTFGSVSDALEFIDTAGARFDVLGPDTAYSIAVRSRIDVNALPAPLRPTALFFPEWQLSSDWTQWPIEGSSTN